MTKSESTVYPTVTPTIIVNWTCPNCNINNTRQTNEDVFAIIGIDDSCEHCNFEVYVYPVEDLTR